MSSARIPGQGARVSLARALRCDWPGRRLEALPQQGPLLAGKGQAQARRLRGTPNQARPSAQGAGDPVVPAANKILGVRGMADARSINPRR